MSPRNRQNWQNVRLRVVLRRQVLEKAVMAPVHGNEPRTVAATKAEQRAEADAAFEQWRQKQKETGR